jgi:hypothetical protein
MSQEKGMKISILPDGTIKAESGDLSGVGHYSADEFVKMMGRLAGGRVEVQKLDHTHTHEEETERLRRYE